jgi:hypothetical protein
MNTNQVISKESVVSDGLFIESPFHIGYLWENLVIEKRISLSWAYKLYKGTIVDAFGQVLSSGVS